MCIRDSTKTVPMHTFNGVVEHAIAHIEEAVVHEMPEAVSYTHMALILYSTGRNQPSFCWILLLL